jgi:hypothetical protein
VIRAAGLLLALLLGPSLAGAPLDAGSTEPALVRLAEQSGCSGTPLDYVAGYFSPADQASGIFWCRRDERVLHDARLPLTAFVVRHEPWRTGPAGHVTSGPIVDAADGAVGEQWVCHQGAWLVRVHH